ncbi:MAG: alpha-amylase family glycosyl hydrolase [Pseudomonadota bacterium]
MMRRGAWLTLAIAVGGCASIPEADHYVGTESAHASDAVYFAMTDRFVDGDPGNNQTDQGPPGLTTFDRPITNSEGQAGNIGYLGGDFRGLLNNAGYIRDMGFGALWITPIVQNPDEAFSGGSRLGDGVFADNGKTGYHGYWGVNFFEIDEHLTSAGLGFAELTTALRDEFGLATILDIVCNHGSPSYSMPADQPMYGEIYDASGALLADHQNLHPTELDPNNPLHTFYRPEPDLAELSNNDDENAAVLEYYVAAYLKWIEAGAAAFRIDTIRHMPHPYWKAFSDRIRAEHPGFFMFGESFDFNAATIAEHTYPENGAISVLDFPGQRAITNVFAASDGDFADLAAYLHLTDGVYENPYDLMTFYDNHDMPRMAASDTGFIDAHNWLFTSRGTPVIYYGSEVGFRAGRPEHGGNRDFFGQDNVDQAPSHAIHRALTDVAQLRRAIPALQRGLQVNLSFRGDQAAFLRVLETAAEQQTALVLLNKADSPTEIRVRRNIDAGIWRDAASGETLTVDAAREGLTLTVPAHGVRVMLRDGAVTNPRLRRELDSLQHGVNAAARRRSRR